jgi:hypothetical protein
MFAERDQGSRLICLGAVGGATWDQWKGGSGKIGTGSSDQGHNESRSHRRPKRHRRLRLRLRRRAVLRRDRSGGCLEDLVLALLEADGRAAGLRAR